MPLTDYDYNKKNNKIFNIMEKRKTKSITHKTDTRGRSHRQWGAGLRVTSAAESTPRPLHNPHHRHWLRIAPPPSNHLPLSQCLAAACGSLIGWKHTSPAHQKKSSIHLPVLDVATPPHSGGQKCRMSSSSSDWVPDLKGGGRTGVERQRPP